MFFCLISIGALDYELYKSKKLNEKSEPLEFLTRLLRNHSRAEVRIYNMLVMFLV